MASGRYKLIILFIVLSVFLFCTGKVNVVNTMVSDNIELPEFKVDENGDVVGTTTDGFLLENFPEFNKSFNNYRPDRKIIEKINNSQRVVDVLTVFGSWCSDSEKYVGEFLTVADKTSGKLRDCVLIGVDRQKKEPDHVIQKFGIQKLPTFIIFENGKEIGRIVEKPSERLERDIWNIIKNGSGKE